MFLVGEQVNILRRARRQAIGQQRVAAAEREPVPRRCGQGEGGDLSVQIA
jgi:hypothetical protein